MTLSLLRKLWPCLALTALLGCLGFSGRAEAQVQGSAVALGEESLHGVSHSALTEASPQLESPELAECEREDDDARGHYGCALRYEMRRPSASRSEQAPPVLDAWAARVLRAAHPARGPPSRRV